MIQMMKKIMRMTSTSTIDRMISRWKPGKEFRWNAVLKSFKLSYKTYTAKPKGKQGKLIENWMLEFGQKKFEFKKFGSASRPFDDGFAFIKALEKKGFKTLGSGAFSTVLGKDGSDRVIKVIRRPDGWIDYIHWASKKGEAGRFAPKVFSYKKIKGKKKDFSVAIVERLEYTLEVTPIDHALKILPDLIWRANDNPMAASFADVLAPGLRKFMDDMGEKFEKKNFDLHNGNLMLRKDGSFVVADPVCDGDKSDYKRLKAGDFSPALTFRLLIAA